jgi:Bacterial Ig domain/Purple acid Phosphatase, N-terminal domain/Glucodextranase, domain B
MSSKRACTSVSRLVFGAVLSGCLVAQAATIEAGILDASWTAPTTNTDGSPLTDLSSYRVYYGTSSSPCPGSATSVVVASPTSSPTAGQPKASVRLSGLATRTTYNVSVTAVDTAGNQSGCSGVASAEARADFSVSPSSMSFGSVNLGSSADRTFVVSNTEGGVLSGSVSLAAQTGNDANPFTIVSGNPINLSGPDATQNVTIRFTPSTTTTVSTNLIFAVGGGTVSTSVTGSGAGTDTTQPTVRITSPTSADTHTTSATSLSLSGTASDNTGVIQVSWVNSRGGIGTAAGTVNWSATGIALQTGSNVLTVTARDAAGNTSTDTLTVTVTVNDTVAPSITITSPTANSSLSTSSSSLSIGGTAADNVGVPQVSWTNNRGGNGMASGTSNWSAAGILLQTGSNVITVTGRDAAGNSSTDTLTVTYNPVVTDTTPPSVTIAPLAGAVSAAVASPVTLTGTASDNVAVTQVTWANSRGGGGTAAGTTSWTASGITLQTGSNVITVTARDAAGNVGSASMTVAQSDTAPPAVAVTAPSAGASVRGAVNLTANATDNVGVGAVRFKIDGVDFGAEITRPPYTMTWDTTSVADGAHIVTAVARDAAGNVTRSSEVRVSVANTSPDEDERRPGISRVAVSDVTTSQVRISWTTDEASNSQVEYGRRFYRNRSSLDRTLVTSHSQVLTGLAPSTWYHFRVRSRDAAGNLGVSRDFWFRTDGRDRR